MGYGSRVMSRGVLFLGAQWAEAGYSMAMILRDCLAVLGFAGPLCSVGSLTRICLCLVLLPCVTDHERRYAQSRVRASPPMR